MNQQQKLLLDSNCVFYDIDKTAWVKILIFQNDKQSVSCSWSEKESGLSSKSLANQLAEDSQSFEKTEWPTGLTLEDTVFKQQGRGFF